MNMSLSDSLPRDAQAGKWVPSYYGNRFRPARLVGRDQYQEEGPVFKTLEECVRECERRNRMPAASEAAG